MQSTTTPLAFRAVLGRSDGPGPTACEHGKNWPTEALEQAARRCVLSLLRNPEVMRQ